jgi:hypothetical protein
MNDNFYFLLACIVYVLVITWITKSIFDSQQIEHGSLNKDLDRNNVLLFGRFTRSIIFMIISSILLFRANYILELFDIRYAEWYVSLILAVTFGLIYAFLPVTSSKSLAYLLLLIHIRFIYLIIAALLFTILMIIELAIASIIILLPISIFITLGYLIIMFGKDTYGVTGASVATIFLIAIILSTARRAYNLTKLVLSKSVKPIHKIGYEDILGSWKKTCISLHNLIRQYAIFFGYKMGGDLGFSTEKKTT